MDGPPRRSVGTLFDNLDFSGLSDKAQARLDVIGEDAFIRACYAMLAIFCSSIILWITEAVQSYLTSLMVILGVILCGVTTQKESFAQLGHPVMWLNILSFVLASMLVKTKVAKRFALWFVLKFGKSAFMTGSGANLLAVSLLMGAYSSVSVIYADWLVAAFPPLSLSFPVSLLIEHVYVLPFNSKPAALLYTTNHYSWSDTFKFGITMMVIAWIMILIWGETVLHWLGYTPRLF